MKARLIALCLILLATSAVASPGDNLPNACAITATETVARLMAAGVKWVKMLEIHYLTQSDGLPIPIIEGHVMTVWQPYAKGPIMVYDRSGSMILKTHSQELTDIIKCMNELNPDQPILAAKFVE